MFPERVEIVPASNHMMLWVGELSQAELLSYVDEPGDRNDGQPQSEFARDLGRFYDHDFLWGYAAPEASTIRELALGIGVKDAGLIAELERRAGDKGPISCFLILWNYHTERPLPPRFANGKLRFVGSWAYPAPYTDD